LTAQILQQQWRRNLNVDVKLLGHDFPTFLQIANNLQYQGIADSWDCGRYTDPNWFLSQFQTGAAISGTGWADPIYDRELTRANATLDPAERMTKLAECEKYLLTAMPVIPLYVDSRSYLHKPYVRGGGGNLLNILQFKYAWIDTNWRPS
jgi:oligopeptide transport system substrate-binding protein